MAIDWKVVGEVNPSSLFEEELIPIDRLRKLDDSIQGRRNRNKISRIEQQIINQQRHGARILSECLQLRTSVELACFDMLYSDFIFGDTPSSEIRNFIDRVTSPMPNVYSRNERDVDVFAGQICSTMQAGGAASRAISKIPKKRAEPKRPVDHVYIMKDIKSKYDSDLLRTRAEQTPRTNSILIKYANVDGPSNQITKPFMKKLVSIINPTSRQPEILINQRSEVRKAISSANHIAEYQHKMHELEQIVEQVRECEHTTLVQSDLEGSPYISYSIGNYRFLTDAFMNTSNYRMQIQAGNNIIKRCSILLDDLAKKARSSSTNFQNILQMAKQNVQRQSQCCTSNLNEIRSYLEAIVHPFDASNFRHSIESIENDVTTFSNELSSHPQIYSTFSEYKAHLHEFIAASNSNIMAHESTAILDKRVYEIQMRSFVQADVLDRLREVLKRDVPKYTEEIQQIYGTFNFDSIKRWSNELAKSIVCYVQALIRQNTLNKNAASLLSANSDDIKKVCHELTESLESLQETEKELIDQEMHEAIELKKVRDRISEMIMEREALRKVETQKVNRKDLAKYKSRVICPICRKNPRDTIITPCYHAACKECMTKSKNSCPLCHSKGIFHNIYYL